MNKCSCCVVTTNNPERFTILEKILILLII